MLVAMEMKLGLGHTWEGEKSLYCPSPQCYVADKSTNTRQLVGYVLLDLRAARLGASQVRGEVHAS